MGSSSPVLVFMVHLEETLVPRLQEDMPIWKRYVDDTFSLVKIGKRNEIVSVLNNFHPNIQFTHEIKKEEQIAFLDILLKREEDGKLQTSV